MTTLRTPRVDAEEIEQRPFFVAAHFVCFWHKADICLRCGNVRFWG